MLRKAKKVTLYDDIVGQIEQLIRDGRFRPGDKLPPERELAEQLGISRNTLREALKALDLMGVLEAVQGGGSYVSKDLNTRLINSSFRFMSLNEDKEIFDLLEARRILESANAYSAAKNATPELIEALRKDLEAMKENIDRTEITSKYDSDFHLRIAEASGNLFLNELTKVLRTPLMKLMLRTTYIKDLMPHTIEFHEKIILALESRDPEMAEKYMREHLAKIESEIKEGGLEG